MTEISAHHTRFNLPQLRPDSVPRSRLIEQLNSGLTQGKSLILLAAPAGFGKTTLLTQWIQDVELPTAWISADEELNNPETFLRYVIEAVRPFDPQISRSVLDLLGTSSPVSLTENIGFKFSEPSASSERILLVIDDYHLIRSMDVHETVSQLIESMPGMLCIVIGTREDPPLPLARLRARGQLTELRQRAPRRWRSSV